MEEEVVCVVCSDGCCCGFVIPLALIHGQAGIVLAAQHCSVVVVLLPPVKLHGACLSRRCPFPSVW
jgi:hypothetical protein